jgi:two-component system chemotaxis response regulator CheB
LTGGNPDGAAGLAAIARRGGRVLVQDPAEASVRAMPEAAIAACPTAEIFDLTGIAGALQQAGA